MGDWFSSQLARESGQGAHSKPLDVIGLGPHGEPIFAPEDEEAGGGDDADATAPPAHLAGIVNETLQLDTDRRLGFAMPPLSAMSAAVMVGLRCLEMARNEHQADEVKRQQDEADAARRRNALLQR